ncbi:MAG: FAD-dependent oxidoreductase, partial [Chloroflexi bacterium]
RPTFFYQLKLRIGMQLYDALSLDKSLPRRQHLDRAATLAAEPTLEPDGLTGAWRFYDAQVPLVERLVVENLVDAAERGALVLNHARVIDFLREGDRILGARVRDTVAERDIEVRARFTVVATGPWLDRTIAPLRKRSDPLLRLTKGVHIVTRRAVQQALLRIAMARRDDSRDDRHRLHRRSGQRRRERGGRPVPPERSTSRLSERAV